MNKNETIYYFTVFNRIYYSFFNSKIIYLSYMSFNKSVSKKHIKDAVSKSVGIQENCINFIKI